MSLLFFTPSAHVKRKSIVDRLSGIYSRHSITIELQSNSNTSEQSTPNSITQKFALINKLQLLIIQLNILLWSCISFAVGFLQLFLLNQIVFHFYCQFRFSDSDRIDYWFCVSVLLSLYTRNLFGTYHIRFFQWSFRFFVTSVATNEQTSRPIENRCTRMQSVYCLF